MEGETDIDFLGLSERAREFGWAEVRTKRGGHRRAATTLETLKAQNVAVQAAVEGLNVEVRNAREFGCSWTDIGLMLGITRQAAHERFAKVIGHPTETPRVIDLNQVVRKVEIR